MQGGVKAQCTGRTRAFFADEQHSHRAKGPFMDGHQLIKLKEAGSIFLTYESELRKQEMLSKRGDKFLEKDTLQDFSYIKIRDYSIKDNALSSAPSPPPCSLL